MNTDDYDATAPPGTVFVCAACGKLARNRSTGGITPGWDTSCMTRANLCTEESVVIGENGCATKATAIGVIDKVTVAGSVSK